MRAGHVGAVGGDEAGVAAYLEKNYIENYWKCILYCILKIITPRGLKTIGQNGNKKNGAHL